MHLLNDYSRFYLHTNHREVAVVYSVHRLVDSLDRGAQGNAEIEVSAPRIARETNAIFTIEMGNVCIKSSFMHLIASSVNWGTVRKTSHEK